MRLIFCFLAISTALAAAPLHMTLPPSPPATVTPFKLGTAAAPNGVILEADSRSLSLNGQRWIPVMGEFHFSRYPEDEWREELLKMKAGGIDIVATYVFWIHHEEIKGTWNWSGRRNLRHFIEAANEVGLKVIVRCGPWCHGEVRNGGLPDWVVAQGDVRSDNPAYLEAAQELYRQIAGQLHGLLWKDGGPVIGIQLENEYSGPAEHLLTLKKMARAVGLDVPLYSRTGWPQLQTEMPFGEILPLYGVYSEGFWDRELTSMPGKYWSGFHFSTQRDDANIASDALGNREAQDPPDVARYPYLTCEIGGGMMSSYHRRIRIDPLDVEATTLIKLGSGSNSLGYYMYHGGVNPEGQLSTLMEEQATPITNWNDMPVKNYDFQAPLGMYGQIRPQYHWLRRLHLFLHDFGPQLAEMTPSLPDLRPRGRDDVTTLRWAARSQGLSGYVFINNYERLRELPAKPGVQFALEQGKELLSFPAVPVDIPAGTVTFWPFNLELSKRARLVWATAQPICTIDNQAVRTYFFAETPGVASEFALETAAKIDSFSNRRETVGKRVLIYPAKPGRAPAIRIGDDVEIVLLSAADSLALWKTTWGNRDYAFITPAGLVIDGRTLRLTTSDPASTLAVSIYPSAPIEAHSEPDGIFTRFTPDQSPAVALDATAVVEQAAGLPRKISLAKTAQPVAVQPSEKDFNDAAVWSIPLPKNADLSSDIILRLTYTGDVARVRIGDKLITDDFYNGAPLEIGLHRHRNELKNAGLQFAILPLQNGAPIFLPKEAKPSVPSAEPIAIVRQAELVTVRHAELTLSK